MSVFLGVFVFVFGYMLCLKKETVSRFGWFCFFFVFFVFIIFSFLLLLLFIYTWMCLFFSLSFMLSFSLAFPKRCYLTDYYYSCCFKFLPCCQWWLCTVPVCVYKTILNAMLVSGWDSTSKTSLWWIVPVYVYKATECNACFRLGLYFKDKSVMDCACVCV